MALKGEEVLMKTILVPLDGSALAEQVLPYISQLAEMLHARVCLLRVVSDAQGKRMVAEQAREMYPKVGSLAIQWQREQWAWTTLEQQAERYLTEKAALLRKSGIEVSLAVELGDPAEQIVTPRKLFWSSVLPINRCQARRQM